MKKAAVYAACSDFGVSIFKSKLSKTRHLHDEVYDKINYLSISEYCTSIP